MTGGSHYEVFLRQVLANGNREQHPCYRLPETVELVLGRDPAICQIVLDSQRYGGVSRRHAVLRPLRDGPEAHGLPLWQICDLNSANGTFVNGQRVQTTRLNPGDTLVVSSTSFLVEATN